MYPHHTRHIHAPLPAPMSNLSASLSTQHHRLPPSTAPTNPSVLSSATNSRLNEFFDLIKSEFDAATQDGTVWKQQRDDYEQKSASNRTCPISHSIRGWSGSMTARVTPSGPIADHPSPRADQRTWIDQTKSIRAGSESRSRPCRVSRAPHRSARG